MDAIREVQKRYGSAAMGIAVPSALVFVFCGLPDWGKGLILGALFSVLNFVLMGQTLPLRLGRTRGASTAVSFGSIGLRYAVLSVPLILAVRYEAFHPAATVAGMFMIQIVILADHIRGVARRRGVKRV